MNSSLREYFSFFQVSAVVAVVEIIGIAITLVQVQVIIGIVAEAVVVVVFAVSLRNDL
jgi:uncharacterized membrane protein YkgB